MVRRTFVGAVACALFAVACGTQDDSTFKDSNGDPGSNGVPPGASLGEIGPQGTGSACVSEVQSANLAPTNLVFMFDRSGSMGDPAQGGDPNQKWIPLTSGMKDFFADAYSSTVRASLQFFPEGDIPNPADTEADDIAQECNFAYATPKVPLTQASDPAIVSAIDATTPSGGTPTVPALTGAVTYAKQVAADRPTDKTAIVLVTDGMPGYYTQGAFQPGCTSNDVPTASSIAKSAHDDAKISTYVIGVGSRLDNLNEIAQAGGSGAAIMVDTSDPAKVKSDLVAALDAIRKREVTCDFSVPPPPAGQELDPMAVNVVLAGQDGQQRVLTYSKECATADGWRYDDPVKPTRILLCAAACDAARASSLGKVTLAFGCKTRVEVR